ncbi:MAG: PTS sugar transporter subunit IIA [Alphaproteobacteria bacterium]
MLFAELLPKEAVFPHVEARDKKQALRHMAAHAGHITGVPEKDIYSEIMEREQHGTTCMGSGVCVPHGRFPKLSKPVAFFAHFNEPVEFDGADGQPVDLMFMLLSPQDSNTEHIKAMAMLSRLLRNKLLCTQLRKAGDSQAMYELLYTASKEDQT